MRGAQSLSTRNATPSDSAPSRSFGRPASISLHRFDPYRRFDPLKQYVESPRFARWTLTDSDTGLRSTSSCKTVDRHYVLSCASGKMLRSSQISRRSFCGKTRDVVGMQNGVASLHWADSLWCCIRHQRQSAASYVESNGKKMFVKQ